MNFWETATLNFCCSLIASLLFLFVILWLFKPRIKISPFVCFNNDQFEDEEQENCIWYYFKIVNHSWFYLYDVKVELFKMYSYPTAPSGMTNKRRVPLELTQTSVSFLGSYRPPSLRKDAKHCYRFRTKDDLKVIAKDRHASFQIEVTCRHGLTGLVKVFQHEYSELAQIKAGKFSYGTKFDILKESV